MLSLPAGYRLQEFVIESTIGEGGFGIVYRAVDTKLGRTVAIKEFLPVAFANRTRDFEVSVRSESHRNSFEVGRRSFINEAQLLAQFDHPALVKVYRYWEENGTAYIVMPYYAGQSLKTWVGDQQGGPSESQLIRVAGALAGPLALLHASGVFHRDIAPDNIRILENDQPVLLDLGAARRILADMTQTVTAFVKAGYAPIEQYAQVDALKQGPWTDVYALAATMYYCIAGKAPPPSVARIVNDECVPAAVVGTGRYSPGFLAAIDHALAIRPDSRTRTIAEFLAGLRTVGPGARPAGESPTFFGNAKQGASKPTSTAGRKPRSSSGVRVGTAATGIFLALVLGLAVVRVIRETEARKSVVRNPTAVPAASTMAATPASTAAAVAPVQPLMRSDEAAPAQAAIFDATAGIARIKRVVGEFSGAPPALFAASDAALDDARAKLAVGQAQAATAIAKAAADDAKRSARDFLVEREIGFRRTTDQRLRAGDIGAAEAALERARAVRALERRL